MNKVLHDVPILASSGCSGILASEKMFSLEYPFASGVEVKQSSRIDWIQNDRIGDRKHAGEMERTRKFSSPDI